MAEVLERGDIFFLYRPKVGMQRVRGLDDVQRLFVILKPDGRQRLRYLVVGRKRLPAPDEHERIWGFVELVGESAVDIQDELDPVEYQTRTRGPRRQAPARPAGEGVYVIAPHNGHTHLAYALELPERRGPVQHELNIGQDVSLIAAVRNPDADGWPHVRRPSYPPELRERFGDRAVRAAGAAGVPGLSGHRTRADGSSYFSSTTARGSRWCRCSRRCAAAPAPHRHRARPYPPRAFPVDGQPPERWLTARSGRSSSARKSSSPGCAIGNGYGDCVPIRTAAMTMGPVHRARSRHGRRH